MNSRNGTNTVSTENGSKTNIMFVHANNDDVGGADYCLFKLVYELKNDVFNPFVVLAKETSVVELYKKHDIPVIMAPMMRMQKNYNPLFYVKLLWRLLPTLFGLRKLIREHNISVVFSNDLLDFYGSAAARLAGVKAAQYVRMIMPGNSPLKIAMTRMALLLNHKVLVVSRAVGRYMFPARTESGLHKKVEVVHDWIDMELVGHADGLADIRSELGMDGKVLVTSVSRLDPWKGQRVFVKSAAQICAEYDDVEFLVVGGTVRGRNRESYRETLEKLTEELNCSDRVHFLGERKDVHAILSGSDIFVHSPVLPDPFPGVVLEAMASSKIVIGSDDGGIPEEIENQVTGLLFRMGDAEDLSDRLRYVLDHRRKITEMGKNGYTRVTKKFTKEQIFPQMRGILQELGRNQKEPNPELHEQPE